MDLRPSDKLLPSGRPVSDGLFALSVVGLLTCLPFSVVGTLAGINPFIMVWMTIAIYAMPQLFHAFAEHGPNIRRNFNLDVDQTVLIKLLALGFILALFGLLLHFWSFYDQPRFLLTKFTFFLFLPIIALVAVPYFCTVNRMQGDKKDEYYHMGALLIGQWSEVDWAKIRHFWLGWFIKLFFFPLMFWELTRTIASVHAQTFSSLNFDSISKLVYIADVVIASAGYLFTLRLFGWQIRSVSPFVSGWFFTLLCYYPFFHFVNNLSLQYEDGLIWSDWLANHPIALLLWGAQSPCSRSSGSMQLHPSACASPI